jgi:NADPH:quinone reductase
MRPNRQLIKWSRPLTPGFLAGDYRAAPITQISGLGEGSEAYRKVAAGAAGRVVLWPQE